MRTINLWLEALVCQYPIDVIRVYLTSQSALEKHNQEKKCPQTFAHLVNFSNNVSAMFDNHTILLFWLEWTNLSHVLAAWSAFRALFTWSRRTTCAKDHRLFSLNYPQINKVSTTDHIVWPWIVSTENRCGYVKQREELLSWFIEQTFPFALMKAFYARNVSSINLHGV